MEKTFFVRKKIAKLSMLPALAALIFLSFSAKKNEEIGDSLNDKSVMVVSDELAMNYSVDSSVVTYPVLEKDYNGFKAAVAFQESRGQYELINTIGYMGKYQFGQITLAALGVQDAQDFLVNPALQEATFYAFLARNKWILEKDINNYDGKIIDGVEVTESGILAAAHLAGPGGIRKYLRSGGRQSAADIFGTTIKQYLEQFGGYDLSTIPAVRNAKVKSALAQG